MKKLLGITLALASLGALGSNAEAATIDASQRSTTVAAHAGAQWQRNNNDWRWRRNRRVRRVTTSRLVRIGRRVYRETYIVTYLSNGRATTQLISRSRVS